MHKEISWEYYIDDNVSATTGMFFLYRNPIYEDDNGYKYFGFSTYPQPPESSETPLTMTLPIASGITAFFAGGFGAQFNLYRSLRNHDNFDAVHLYKIYLRNVSKWVFLENTRSPKPKPEQEVNLAFLIQHLEDEKKCLLDSVHYYLECYDENDLTLKAQLKDYVNGYFIWIENKLNELSKNTNEVGSKLKARLNQSSTSPKPKPLTLASELSPMEFITAIEQILSFTYGCFRDQAFPKSRPGFIWLTEALSKKDLGYYYQIHIDPNFFNFSRFMTLVRSLFIDKNIKTEEFKIILKKCYSASKANHELYTKHLDSKKFEEYYTIFLEFACTSGQINYFLDPSNDMSFELYSNQDLGHFSTVVFNFLENEIFNDKIDDVLHSTSQKDNLSVISPAKELDNQSTSSNNSTYQGNNKPHNSSNNKSISNILSDLFNNSDIKSIDVLETILDTINYLFRDQAYPESRDSFTHFLRLPKGEKTYYCYLIDNGNQIINFLMFKEKLRSLMLRSDIDKAELKKILNKSYSDAKSNIQIFKEYIEPEKLPMEKNILLQFDFKKLSFSVLNNQPVSFSPAFYTNQRLANFSGWIAEFLEEEVYFNEAVSKTQSTVNRIESPMKTNPQIIAVSYFNRTESFLQKIVELFYLQLDPAMKAIRADQLGIGFNHDTDCEYFIPPSTNLLDFTYFKDNFGFLLLQKKKEDEGLQLLLSETFNLCIKIMSLFEDRLGNLQQVKTVRIFFQEFNGEINYYRDETDPAEGYEILGNYEVYNYALKIYEYMLLKGFTPLATTISSEKTNPLIEDGHSVPKQSETEEIIHISDESETNFDPVQFISDILEPLTKENFTVGKNKKLVYCIDSSFKTHLTSCFLALIKDTERPKYHPQFKIRSQNAPFYDAIILIKEKFQFKTMDVIIIIADSFNKDFDDLSKGAPNTIRNEISYAKTRKLRKNI